MAKKTKKVELKEVERIELGNGSILVKYEDGSCKIITEISISAEKAEEIFGSAEEEEDDEEDEDEDDEDDSEDEDEDDSEDEDDDDSDSDDEEEDEDEDEDDDEDDDEEEEEITPEALAEMDFEELEDVCDEKELDTDPDDFEEDDIEKLRAAIAKELGIKLPKKAKKGKK